MPEDCMRNLFAFFLALTFAAPLFAQAGSSNPNNPDARRKQLDALLHEQWEYSLRTNPEFASILGDRRYNDQSADFSEAAVKHDLAAVKVHLARLERIDTTGFPEQEAINKALLARDLRRHIEDITLKEREQ